MCGFLKLAIGSKKFFKKLHDDNKECFREKHQMINDGYSGRNAEQSLSEVSYAN